MNGLSKSAFSGDQEPWNSIQSANASPPLTRPSSTPSPPDSVSSFEVAQVKATGTPPFVMSAAKKTSPHPRDRTRPETGLDPFHVTRLFREILGHSLRTQESLALTQPGASVTVLRVGYQGSEGAYSHLGRLPNTSERKRASTPIAVMTASR